MWMEVDLVVALESHFNKLEMASNIGIILMIYIFLVAQKVLYQFKPLPFRN
jgi:hypothetical protein